MMSILLYLATALVVHLVISKIYRVLSSPLRTIPGPFFARWTRLWELNKVCQGKFEKTNIELHQRYGTLATSHNHTLDCFK